MVFIPTTEANRKEMLKAIGVSDFKDLLEDIPPETQFKGDLSLPQPLSELEVAGVIKDVADRNNHTGSHVCFLGGGAYDHFIPAAVGHVIGRPEFYTAYTPYQPEVSQGNLQAIYEYQSMIAELTAMDVANASMYDGASALAESALLMHTQTGREEILVSKTIHPFYRRVVQTYCHRSGIVLKEVQLHNGITDVDHLESLIGDQTAGLLVQHPNFFGFLEDVENMEKIIHQSGGLFGVSVDPLSLGVLKPPGHYGADVATGEGQVLGNPLFLGGPYIGIFTVKQSFIRRLPGRLVGVTQDNKGRRGFVLTLQTREQHIRREKATSSICTNEQLCALASSVYLALMGKQGIPYVANLCLQKSHYLAKQLNQVAGLELLFKQSFFKEMAVKCPVSPKIIIDKMLEKGIFAGIDLGRFDYGLEHGLLIAVTEKRTKQDMDRYVEVIKGILG